MLTLYLKRETDIRWRRLICGYKWRLLEYKITEIWGQSPCIALRYFRVNHAIDMRNHSRNATMLQNKRLSYTEPITWVHLPDQDTFHHKRDDRFFGVAGAPVRHPSSAVFLRWTLPSIYYRTYFHTSKVTWPGLKRKLIGFPHIVVWHMRVSAHVLEVTWLECAILEPKYWLILINNILVRVW